MSLNYGVNYGVRVKCQSSPMGGWGVAGKGGGEWPLLLGGWWLKIEHLLEYGEKS